ncbi:2-keto-4-pentenoate hydratase/2-oxohepta-3-ene-1,7-dioic acid hydratase in catechol pathway [Arthrobacter globiformis]|uniref:fumarylacetoacetate hydrolase family protein n=1 Tax=Arthrobacter globiformis TaxID=1665 RepID=UPI00277FBB07|nr:fumarylacetoacetate hydrolase family protein [Arthrobacter globiformis]MDQ1060822.1 2-keto-4-pentenoate hydratase/2-oxohepta-3-ene-1,7-dioic acid hydratase in catechol pathway [Arthrobacter globiformis]MDQ1060826.1 2-keto-4-pentenoate hydratase/2-oxohepta-3-ene-1,7-dioic acid hydratase in catechol pathway [Arthrobacter globiformis]
MRIANVDNRAVLLVSDEAGLDVEAASGGRFGPGLAGVYERWEEFRAWAGTLADTPADVSFDRSWLGSPSPAPRQVFAIGLNYSEHAKESGFAQPDTLPPVFTKFPTCITGPDTTVVIPEGGNVDWEVELVAVIGKEARNVPAADAWDHVAGLSIGQDISERVSQLRGPAPQFGLGKSFPGFGPVGPWLVTPDEFSNPDDLELSCSLDGEELQKGRTSELIFSVPALIEGLSATVTLLPGDIIFTGTPAGVGVGRSPKRFIQPGETLVSRIEGIGEMTQTFVSAGN